MKKASLKLPLVPKKNC